jgi:ubiquinone/menaquinone biosynthesis C-methylase UbiE
MSGEWDHFARQNPFYSIASWPEFENQDTMSVETFWSSGRKDADDFMSRMSLNRTRELSLVEIGCGMGRMTHRFAEIFGSVVAVDVSPEMLKRAESYWGHFSHVRFLLGNGRDLHPIPDSSVDVVISYVCLQHLTRASFVLSYIRESARVLRPGGTALLQFRTSRSRLGVAAWEVKRYLRKWVLRRRLPPSLDAAWSQDFDSWRGCTVAASDVEVVAAQTGLRIDRIEGLNTQYTFYLLRRLGP